MENVDPTGKNQLIESVTILSNSLNNFTFNNWAFYKDKSVSITEKDR